MFETFCCLLLRLYPAEFRRVYGREAVQLMRGRARHERGVFLRARLLLDLAIDLGAISLYGFRSNTPLLAHIDGPPWFDVIDMHRPRPAALAGGMVTTILGFAAFTLLLQLEALPNAPAHLGNRSGFAMPGAGSHRSARQTAGYLFDRPTFMDDPRPVRTAAAVSGNNLADRPVYLLASSRAQRSGTFLRINDHVGMRIREAVPPDNPYPVKDWEVIGPEPDVRVSRAEALEAARTLVGETGALPAVTQSPAFEVISITPARSADPRNMRMRVLPNGDLKASALPVLWLLRYAYDVPVNPSPRLSGLPDWQETYDIEAKAPANAVPAGLPESEQRGRIQGMIRGLLADRFKLVMRVEQKTMPVYALTVARGGPNLRKAPIAEKDCIFDTGTPDSCHSFIVGRGHPLNARAISMDDLAQYIENWADLPVVNRTALSGLYAVETEGWTPMRLPPPPPGNPPAARFDDLPTVFAVLRSLGLELKQQEATVPVYTVKHIERPAGE
jgi:uncharacterized protein (TIGR03435 family)